MIYMKKFLIIFFSVLTVVCFLSANVRAENSPQIFAAPSIINEIKNNMYDDTSAYVFLFGSQDVTFDFDSMLPVYYVADCNSPESLADNMVFSERYKVPVYDIKNKFLGFAEFGKILPVNELPAELQNDPSYVKKSTEHEGEWEIKSFSEGGFEDSLFALLNKPCPQSLSSSSNIYYVDIYALDMSGFLYVSDGDENSEWFCEVTNNLTETYSLQEKPMSGNDVAEKLIKLIDYAKSIGGIWDEGGIDWDEANDHSGEVDEYDDSPIEDDFSNSGLGIDEWVYEEPEEDNEGYVWTPSPEDNNTDGGVLDEGVDNGTEPSSPNTGNTSSAIAVASLCGALCLGVISRKKK